MGELYQEKAYEAFYKLQNVNTQIDSYVADSVRGLVATMELDHVFEAKNEIVDHVKERLVTGMQAFGYHILQVLVVDIIPERRVKDAMNEIVAARRMRTAATEKGEADKVIAVKQAEAQKAQMLLQAEAESQSRILQAQGVARARSSIADGLKASVASDGQKLSSGEVQELLLVTQYLDTLEKLAGGRATTVFTLHRVDGLGDIQEQVRAGLMQA